MKFETQTRTVQLLGGALAAILLLGALPQMAKAQGGRGRQSQREKDRQRAQDKRQDTKNDWRNLAIVAGGLTAFGLIKKDPTLSFVGAAGALYSVDRYEQDRRSQDKTAHVRASLFSQQYINRDGRRYDRRVVTSKGHKYYQFTRHDRD